MSNKSSHIASSWKLFSHVFNSFGKSLPEVERLLDRTADGVLDALNNTLSRMVSAAGKGLVLGFTLGLLAIIPAFGAYGLYVTSVGCARPLDYITGLLPTFPDMPRPIGLPHR